jgi:glycosyltransferase involved in cell wall biosynthesis
MRIAFVTAEYVTEDNFDGGLANYLQRVALSLKEQGHEPIIVVLSDTGRDEVFYHKSVEIHRVRFTRSRYLDKLSSLTRGRIATLLYFLRASWVLNASVKRIHEKKPISIIQYTQLGGVGFFRPGNIPNITRLSSFTPLVNKYGGYSGLTSLEIYLQSLIEKRALMRTENVFGPSKQVASFVEKDIGKPVEIIESPFIMDILTLDETIYKKNLDDKKYLLYFGTLNELKGVATIAETLPILLKKYPDIYFVFVGKESIYQGEPMMNYVRKKAEQFISRVIHFGKINHEQLYPIIMHAFAVVLPSLFDNFPNTCLEAMWHRRVIIGTKETSFEQLLTHGQSGFLCEAGNRDSLLTAIESAMGLPETKRIDMGESAYQRVLKLHPDRVVKQLVSFYEKAINQRSN